MNHQLLLISRDLELAERVRRALPAVPPLELRCASRFEAASDPRGWLLVLADGEAAPPLPEAVAAPILWIGDAVRDAHLQPGGRILDYLERSLTPSKLAFILHQHAAAAYLRRMRRLGEEPPLGLAGTGVDLLEVQGRLNNLLAGILGNAELAREAARLSPPLARRLERICGLADEMRGQLLRLHPLSPPPGALGWTLPHNRGVTADAAAAAPQFNWKAALLTVRTQIADYEREGTSTPGKLKRAARLRNCRLALRDCGTEHAPAAAHLRQALGEIEKAEKDDNWRRVAELIPRTLHQVDDLIGRGPA